MGVSKNSVSDRFFKRVAGDHVRQPKSLPRVVGNSLLCVYSPVRRTSAFGNVKSIGKKINAVQQFTSNRSRWLDQRILGDNNAVRIRIKPMARRKFHAAKYYGNIDVANALP